MAGGVELGVGYLSVVPETSKVVPGINSALSSAQTSADGHGRGIGSKLAGGVASTFKVGAAAAGAAGAAIIGTALSQGMSRVVAIDDAKGKLAGLGHTAEGVQTIMDSALASVKGTAYGLGDAAGIAASAVAAGIKPGQELTKYLSLAGDAATIAGSSLGEMGSIFNKVQTSGKAYTDNLNQLADRGIPIFQWLQDEYKVSAKGLSDMVKAGEVDAATFQKVIKENIGGAALESGKTLRGSFANMKAALGRAGANAIEPFLPMMKAGLARATEFADKVAPKVKVAAEFISNGLGDLGRAFMSSGESIDGPATKFEQFGVTARKVSDGVKGVWSILSRGDYLGSKMTFGLEEDSKVVDVLFRIREGAQSLWDVLRHPSAEKFTSFLDTVKGSGDGASNAMGKVESGANGLSGALKSIGSAVAGGATALLSLGGDTATVAVAGIKALGSVMGFFADHTGLATAALAGYAASVAVAKTAETGFHMARIANAIMMPAQIAVQIAQTRAIVAHTAALWANTGAQAPNTALTLRAKVAEIARTAATRLSSAATVQATTTLGAYAIAQRAAAAQSGVFMGGMHQAAAGAATLGARVQGLAGGAMSGLKTAMSSTAAMVGGPVVGAIMAAGAAFMMVQSDIDKSRRQHELLREASMGVSDAQREMADALKKSGGVMTDSALTAFVTQVEDARRIQSELADTTPGLMSRIGAGWQELGAAVLGTGDSFARTARQQTGVAEASKEVTDTLGGLDMTNRELATAIQGTDGEFARLVGQLDLTTHAGKETYSWLLTQRTEFDNTRAAAKALTPGYAEIAEQFKIMGDSSKSANDQATALNRTLRMIGGAKPDLADATSEYDQLTRDVVKATPIDQSKGASADLLNEQGGVSTKSENGEALKRQLDGIRDKTAELATAGGDVNKVFSDNEQLFASVAQQYGRDVGEIRKAAELLGYNERVIRITTALEGADGVTKELGNIWGTIQTLGPGEPKVITIDTLTDDAKRKIEELGGAWKQVTGPDGKPQFRIDMDNAEALAKLEATMVRVGELNALRAQAKIDLDTSQFDTKTSNSKALIGALSALQATPGADLLIDKLQAGKAVSVAEILDLSKKTANPQVVLEIAKALADAGEVNRALDHAARERRAVILPSLQQQVASGQLNLGQAMSQLYPPIPQNAAGGTIVGPGTGTSDSILGIDRLTKLPTSWVSKGEEVTAEKPASKWRWLLKAINRDEPWLEALPRHAAGGTVGEALSAARSVNGNTYAWGGTGPTNFDCSGFVGWLQQIVMGLGRSTKRLYTTMSLIGGSTAGLVPGLNPASPFNVGVSDEHMAADLDGNPVESGGAMGTSGIGAGRAGASDGQFPHKYHLPLNLIPGGGEGGTAAGYAVESTKPKWTEKDDLALKSARVSIEQAKEARDKVYANDKKSAADRSQADLRVQRAEQRVIDLEAKRDESNSASAMSTISPAPELTGGMSDEQLQIRNAEISVTEAQLSRDRTYSDPKSTSMDKEKSDLSVYSAQNQLVELQKRLAEEKGKDKGKGSDQPRLKSFTELGSDLGGILAGGLLETFGLQDTILADPSRLTAGPDTSVTGAYTTSELKKPEAPSGAADPRGAAPVLPSMNISPAEAMTQLPITPGPGMSMQDWLTKFSAFDNGGLATGLGLLPKAVIAPERVLDPVMTPKFERLVSVLEQGDPFEMAGGPAMDAPMYGGDTYAPTFSGFGMDEIEAMFTRWMRGAQRNGQQTRARTSRRR